MFARRLYGALGIVLAAGLVACQPADPAQQTEPTTATSADAMSAPPVIEVITTDYAFTAPPKFPSGWVTLRMKNEAEQSHFLVLWRLPEDKDFGDYSAEIVAPFSSLYKEYRAGMLDQAAFFEALLAALPDWYPVESRGGLGLTSPGLTSQTTVYLEPGDYVMECYVRARESDDEFHSELGMLRPLIVTDESSGAPAPAADIAITLSNYEVEIDGELTAGEHTVSVHVTEEPEGLLGHDIHLARLDADTRVEDVVAWMSWVDALLPPAPAEFLGGAEQVSAGLTTYFTVTLEPGRYAWISEGYGAQGMVKEFTIE